MVSWAAHGVYKVDQASGQWQWYSLDDRPTAVGGREHVLPQGALYIDPRTERCGCEYFFLTFTLVNFILFINEECYCKNNVCNQPV